MPTLGTVPTVELKFHRLPTGWCILLYSVDLAGTRHPPVNGEYGWKTRIKLRTGRLGHYQAKRAVTWASWCPPSVPDGVRKSWTIGFGPCVATNIWYLEI
jgi:hypothetical protein